MRVNDVEDKATTCIKEARTQLKKTKLIDKQTDAQEKTRLPKVRNSSDGENSDEDEEMEIDESQIDEQIEVSALTTDNLDKLQKQLHQVLNKQTDSDAFNIDADNRYADFAECISKMEG